MNDRWRKNSVMNTSRDDTKAHATLLLSNLHSRFRAGILFLALALTLVLADVATTANASDAFLQRFPVGFEPSGLAFDGTNIWVVNQRSNTVTKLRARDGANEGTFAVGR